MAFECPSCFAETAKLIIYEHPKKLGCPNCGTPKVKPVSTKIGQTLDKWEHVDKKGIVHKHRLTGGKSWEIDNRRTSPDDGHTVVNRATGKPTEY